MEPTLRQQLLERCQDYLARQTAWDWIEIPVEYDQRPAEVRRFRAGGDDLPPECLTDKPPHKRPVHRPERAVGDALEWTVQRAKNERSSPADHDRFVLGGGGIGLGRITAILWHAARHWQPKASADPATYFDVGLKTFPASLDETGNALAKAWTLFERTGVDLNPLVDHVVKAFARAPWQLDPFTQLNPPADQVCKDRWPDLQPLVLQAFKGKLFSYTDANHVAVPQYPPTTQAPLPPGTDPCGCAATPAAAPAPAPCVPPPRVLEIDVALPDALARSGDALLAAFGTESGDDLVADLRELGFADSLIARMVLWLSAVWATVPEERRRAAGTEAWSRRHNLDPTFGVPGSPEFEAVPPVFYMLRQFARLSRLTVREALIQLLALSNSRLFEVWSPNSRSGDAELWPEIDRLIGMARVELDAAGRKDAVPYRLSARMLDAATYDEVLHDRMRPADQMPAGTRPGEALASPGLTPLDAYYWRWVVRETTFGHQLALQNDSDFGVMEALRFLGLFRPGGTMRPAAGGNGFDAAYEAWIAALVPDWFVRFATAALLRFKYWIDDDATWRAGGEEMVFWSENHQIAYTSSECAAGALWPDATFEHGHRGQQQSGAWHRERALQRAERWLRDRLRFGFSEVNSPVYYNVQIPALLNLLDFGTAPGADGTRDPVATRVHTLTLMALDLIVFDVALRVCQGSFVTATPRAYFSGKSSGWGVSIRDFVELLTGTVGDVSGTGDGAAVFLSTSAYRNELPECLIAIGREQSAAFIARSRTSLDLADAADLGIGFDSAEDMMFWWSRSAYFTVDTYRATQSWSNRWHLRDTAPFKILSLVDGALWRLLHAVAGGVGILAMWTGLYALYMPLALLLTPRAIRSAVDIITTVFDIVSAGIDAFGKAIGALDEDDDRLRLAKTAFEQEFERALIEFNAGSVMERQHLMVWRSADAMLSSLVADHPHMTSAQKQTCIANLGPDVSVFVGKPLESDVGPFTFVEAAAAGLEDYLEVWRTVPGAVGVSDQPVAPELGELARAGALAASGDDIFAAGPSYWAGDVSNPLVWQYENVAIAIYRTTSHQRDLSGRTHAHWPWDHFDEVRTVEASGGRWLFGRRDRRFPPRTPCPPRAENRPSDEVPWPEGSRRRRDPDNGGAGYVALFSANGMKTQAADPKAPFTADDAGKADAGWGAREIVADGHDNIWIIAVGDELTYGVFDTFVDRVKACALEVDVDDGNCTFELPQRAGPKLKMEVAVDDGAKVHRPADAESPLGSALVLETRLWPRWSFEPSATAPAGSLRFGVRGGDELERKYVEFSDVHWRVHATVTAPDPAATDKTQEVELSFEHDLRDPDNPQRRVVGLPPRAIVRSGATRLAADFRSDVMATFRRNP